MIKLFGHDRGLSRKQVFALLAVALGTACTEPTDGGPRIPAEGALALDEVIEEAVARGDVPAAVALVVSRDSVLYVGTAGGLAEDEVFQIWSMTKPVTSVALMMLHERGLVGLDDPVAEYLPRFADLQVMEGFDPSDRTFSSRPPRTTLTVRHLLTHTSGIGYGFSNPVLMALGGPGWPAWDLPVLFDPGSRWMYGASTYVVGEIVEAVSGVALDRFFADSIFGPLGMHDTGFTLPAEGAPRLATVFSRSGDTLVPVPASVPYEVHVAGDGGLLSTAADYGRFLRMLLNGGELDGVRILSAESVLEMTSNQIGELVVEEQPGAAPAWSRAFPLGAGRDKFGLGFQVSAGGEPGTRGPGSYGWAGLYNTEFWVDPVAGIGVVLLAQLLPFYDEGAVTLLTDFERALYSNLIT